jgi:CBS domain-containing protein
VSPGTTVLAAMQRMAQEDIGFLVVLDGARLAGVVSERDCARKVLLGQRAVQDVMVRDVMTTSVITVPPEQKIPACVRLMHEKAIRHLPVMRGNEVAGVLSVRDVMGALIERHEGLLRRLAEERLTLLYPDPSSY